MARRHRLSAGVRRIAARLGLAFSAILVAPLPAAAQTAAQPATASAATTTGNSIGGGGLQNRSGAISLPVLGAPPAATASAGGATATSAGTNAGGATGGGGGGSGRAGSGGTGAGSSGSAAASGSSPAPAWLLCPPAGASGEAPFVAGTALSCAP